MTIPLNTIIHGDALEVLKGIPADSFDSCVTDPPYGLGFMGKAWDKSGIANNVDLWREVLRVLKPGAHLLSFGGSRTYHRMACAIEDAGFEIRDQIMWIYGSGFPKSLDVSKAIDKAAGAEREVIEQVRVKGGGMEHVNRTNAATHDYRPDGYQKGENVLDITAPATDAARQWSGWGTALKPAHEPICVARKPFKGTVAENVLQHGTGAINVDGCRIETQQSRPLIISKNGDSKACFGQGLNNSWQDPAGTILGRFPANVIHDGSEEVVGMFPESPGAIADVPLNSRKTKDVYGKYDHNSGMPARGDNGSAARFFYCAKASRDERGPGNNHPTVKPLALIQYLVKLVTPPGGIVLDPFCGSGTLGIAAGKLGMKWQGIELNPKYIEIAERRIEREVGLLLDMEAAHAD
mgnify:FL=1